MSRAWIAGVRGALFAIALCVPAWHSASQADDTFSAVTSWLQTAPEQVTSEEIPPPADQPPLEITAGDPPASLPGEMPPTNPFQAPAMQRPDLRCLNPNYTGQPIKDP